MIRDVYYRGGRRLGQTAEMGCITYQDPNTGLWIGDVNTSCVAGDGSQPNLPYIPGVSPGNPALTLGTPAPSFLTLPNSTSTQAAQLTLYPSSLPEDPNLQSALQLFAGASDPNSAALNSFLPSPSAGIAAALANSSASGMIPGPGLGLATIPAWFWIGLAVVAGVALFGGRH